MFLMKPQTRANLLLLLTALIWGCAFAAQDVAADVLEPMSFNGSRMLLAALTLLPVCWVSDRRAMEVHLNRYRVDEELLRNRYPASYFKTV